jgi:hypothetical protein
MADDEDSSVVMTDVQGACDVKLENEDALKEERS